MATDPDLTPASLDHLSAKSREWVTRTLDHHEIDPTKIPVLMTAAEAMDELEAARRALKKQGATAKDRFGQSKESPAARQHRAARKAFLAAMRMLGLDHKPKRSTRAEPEIPYADLVIVFSSGHDFLGELEGHGARDDEEARALAARHWPAHREGFLEAWRASGRQGLPWAETALGPVN